MGRSKGSKVIRNEGPGINADLALMKDTEHQTPNSDNLDQ